MSEMSEKQRSKVGWENVGNVGAKLEQGGLGKCWSRVRARWERKWYMTPIHIHTFLNSTRVDDPAVAVCLFMLTLIRETEKNFHSAEEHGKICVVDNCLYLRKVMMINYTTYDVRLGQDSINPCNHADIMTLSRHDDDHPFKYS